MKKSGNLFAPDGYFELIIFQAVFLANGRAWRGIATVAGIGAVFCSYRKQLLFYCKNISTVAQPITKFL